MTGQRLEDPGERAAPVGAAVEREVLPSVRVPFRRTGRKVRRVREHAVEPTEPRREVRTDDVDREPFRPRERAHVPERVRIEVGRDDAGARARGRERGEPAPGPDLEQSPSRKHGGE